MVRLLYLMFLSPVIYAITSEAPYTTHQAILSSQEGERTGYVYTPPESPYISPYDDVNSLALVMYTEVRGEESPEEAMRAVGEVVLARVESRNWPDTITEVVWEPSKDEDRPQACAFSALCATSGDLRMLDVPSSDLAFKVAERLLSGFYGHLRITHKSDHFVRCDWVDKTTWDDTMTFRTQVGEHCYFEEGDRL